MNVPVVIKVSYDFVSILIATYILNRAIVSNRDLSQYWLNDLELIKL
jgi:hypothetical protein